MQVFLLAVNVKWSISMSNEVYTTLKSFHLCLKYRGKPAPQRHLKLLRLGGPLENIGLGILEPLPRTKLRNEDFLIITDRYRKLTLAIPLSSITAPEVSNFFPNDWMIFYGIPKALWSDNGPQFGRKLIAALCAFLGTDLRTTKEYHPHTNGRTERYKKTIVSRLNQYVK